MNFQFQSLADFISMDGHGSYVWSCYLFTLLILAVLMYWPRLKKQHLMVQMRRQRRIELNQK